MNVGDVMDELGAALDGVGELRVHPYYADRVTPPVAIVGWPEELAYDTTYGRGSDRLTVPVIVLVGKADARSSRDRLARYADGAGEWSVKAAIEARQATAYDSARVEGVEFGISTAAGVAYLAATFTVDIHGKGT